MIKFQGLFEEKTLQSLWSRYHTQMHMSPKQTSFCRGSGPCLNLACLRPQLSPQFQCFIIEYDVCYCGFLRTFFIRLRKFLSFPSLLGIFIIKECWILSFFFICLSKWSHDFLFFPSNPMNYIDPILNVKPLWIPGINHTQTW